MSERMNCWAWNSCIRVDADTRVSHRVGQGVFVYRRSSAYELNAWYGLHCLRSKGP